MEQDVLDAVADVKKEVVDGLRQRSFWDRALSLLQIAMVAVGGGWVLFTYYMDRYDKASIPAKITVRPSIENVGVRRGLRIMRIQISVENKGARAYVINSPYNVYARRLEPNASGRAVDGTEWDGSAASADERIVVRSGEAFGRGFWFEPGEQSVRTYIIAIPDNEYDLLDIRAIVRHCKVENRAIDTEWKLQPDHSMRTTMIVHVGGTTERYDPTKHRELRLQSGVAMNEGTAQAVLWQTPAEPERRDSGK